ncbi:MAG: class I SAM-dependent methyltransferase [Woeseiaceae bacterium]
MGTDRDWDKWGASDPYFGVLSADEYRSDNLDEQKLAKFFRSGSDYIGNVMTEIRSHLDASFEPKASLDFGCGVGRLVIPLAGISDSVTGVDVSDHMLEETRANCDQRGLENVSLVKSDDELSQLHGSFNLIHSCIVLQHIQTRRGMKIIESLLDHLAPGGVMAIQFYYRCDASRVVRFLVKLRYRFAIANIARNIVRGSRWNEPAMQLHTYDLDKVLDLLKAAGASSVYLNPFTFGEFQSVALYAQKSSADD